MLYLLFQLFSSHENDPNGNLTKQIKELSFSVPMKTILVSRSKPKNKRFFSTFCVKYCQVSQDKGPTCINFREKNN